MSIKSAKERLATIRNEVKAMGQEGALAEFREFFNSRPEVTGIAWTQYAPYFNDGDSCEFSVHDVNYTTADDPKEAFNDFNGYGDYEDPKDGLTSISWDKNRRTDIEKAVIAFWDEIKDDDIFETIFGPDAKVLVTPLGVTIDECRHD
jgi:hypothetical protein